MRQKLDALVECRAGYSGCDYPIAIHWQDQRLTVKSILKEWRSPGVKNYQLLLEDGRQFQVTRDELSGEWQLTLLTHNEH